MKRTNLSFGVLIFALFCARSVIGAAEADTVRVVAAQAVVHLNADPGSLTIATVRAGTILEVDSIQGEWYAVWIPAASPSGTRRLGFLARSDAKFIASDTTTRPAPPARQDKQASDAETVHVLAAEATVHVSADPNSLGLIRVPGGTILDVKAREGAWYSVWLPGETQGLRRLGYVAASDVEYLGGKATASAPSTPAALAPTATERANGLGSAIMPSASPVRTVKRDLDEAQLYTERLPASSRVVIQLFSATDADITKGEKKDETKTLQADGPRILADRFIAKLQELGPFSEVASATSGEPLAAGALIVSGRFVELDPGSRAKRYIGMGAGKSAVSVEGSIKSADGTLLATFKQRRIGVMGMAGGDSLGKLRSDTKDIGADIAKFVSDWAKGNLK